jgi:hypothetical protein
VELEKHRADACGSHGKPAMATLNLLVVPALGLTCQHGMPDLQENRPARGTEPGAGCKREQVCQPQTIFNLLLCYPQYGRVTRKARLAIAPQVCVPPRARFPHKTTKLKIWQKSVPAAGGWLTTSRSPDVTHVLVGSDPAAAASEAAPLGAAAAQQGAPSGAGAPAPRAVHVVHYTWLEACLKRRVRLPEADFGPEAAAAAAAEAEQAAEPPPEPPLPIPGGAPPIPLLHPATHGPPINPQAGPPAGAHRRGPRVAFGSRSSRLKIVDLQRLAMHLLAGGPRPHWLIGPQVGPLACLVLLRCGCGGSGSLWLGA